MKNKLFSCLYSKFHKCVNIRKFVSPTKSKKRTKKNIISNNNLLPSLIKPIAIDGFFYFHLGNKNLY